MGLFYPVVDSARFLDAIAGVVEVADAGYEVVWHAVIYAFCQLLSGGLGIEFRFGRVAPLPCVEIGV